MHSQQLMKNLPLKEGVPSLSIAGSSSPWWGWEGVVSANVVFPHAHRSGSSSCPVGGGQSAWRCPCWPGCPPAGRGVAAVVRRRGFLSGRSDDGGRCEVVACGCSRASRVSTRSFSWESSAWRGGKEAWTAAGVWAQSWGEQGTGQSGLLGADCCSMTSPSSGQWRHRGSILRAKRYDRVQQKTVREIAGGGAHRCHSP
jgi:hypothetical protein